MKKFIPGQTVMIETDSDMMTGNILSVTDHIEIHWNLEHTTTFMPMKEAQEFLQIVPDSDIEPVEENSYDL